MRFLKSFESNTDKNKVVDTLSTYGKILIFLVFTTPLQLFGSHLMSADINYEYINDTTYKLNLSFYTTCDSVYHLDRVGVSVYDYDSIIQKNNFISYYGGPMMLDFVSSTDVSNSCLGCSSPYGIGVKQYNFEKVLNISKGRWLIKYTYSGRYNVSNLTYNSTSTEPFVIEILLDNSNGVINDSPKFLDIPIIYSCIDLTRTYKFISEDADSIAITPSYTKKGIFSLDIPFNNTTLSYPVSYYNYSFIDGMISFNANDTLPNLVSFIIEEFRDGKRISYSTKDVLILPHVCDEAQYYNLYLDYDYFETCVGDTIMISILGTNETQILYSNESNVLILGDSIYYTLINDGNDRVIEFTSKNNLCPYTYNNHNYFIIQLDTLNCEPVGIPNLDLTYNLIHIDTLYYDIGGRFISKNNTFSFADGIYICRIIMYYDNGLVREAIMRKFVINNH